MEKSSFKEKNRAFQEIVREITIIREWTKHNENDQRMLLLLAEGSLTLVAFEHFLRAFLDEYSDSYTLYNLLQKSILKGIQLNAIDNEKAIKILTEVRNSIIHGNFEKAAQINGCDSVGEYFSKFYIAEIEFMHQLLNNIVEQVNIETGEISIQNK